MNNRKIPFKVPMRVPNIGNSNLLDFDPTEGTLLVCPDCKGEIFEKFVRLKKIPRIAKSNKTGKDINLEIISYFCVSCGAEVKSDG